MIIDVKKLKLAGKTQGEFEFSYIPKTNLLTLPNAVIDGTVNVKCSLILQGNDVYSDLTVGCTIVGECARCLKEARYKFLKEASVRFVVSDPEEDDYLYKKGLVDLTEAVNDIIITEEPSVILCKEDCKGLCPVCGADLNCKDCGCKY